MQYFQLNSYHSYNNYGTVVNRDLSKAFILLLKRSQLIKKGSISPQATVAAALLYVPDCPAGSHWEILHHSSQHFVDLFSLVSVLEEDGGHSRIFSKCPHFLSAAERTRYYVIIQFGSVQLTSI